MIQSKKHRHMKIRSIQRPGGSYGNRVRFGGAHKRTGAKRPHQFNASSRGKRFKTDRIDERLFINKAIKQEAILYTAKHVFADFGLSPVLLKNLSEKGYSIPSPIQDQAIPIVMGGKDVIGIANTGTGKTAAFLLPLITKLLNDKKASVMVLAPTRELAQQIEAEFKSFTKGMKLYSVTCVGGSPIGKQIREI